MRLNEIETQRDEYGEEVLTPKGHAQLAAFKKQKKIDAIQKQIANNMEHVRKPALSLGPAHLSTKLVLEPIDKELHAKLIKELDRVRSGR